MGRSKKENQRLAQMFWPFQGQKGFSLAEVMVGAGILGALSLVVVNMTTDINRSQRSMESKFQIGQIQSRIHETLRTPENCALTVKGKTRNSSPNGISLPGIIIKTGDSPVTTDFLVKSDELFGAGNNYNNLTVGDIRLISYIDEDDGSTTGTAQGTTTVSDGSGGTINVEYGDAIIRVPFTKADASEASEVAVAKRSSYGSLEVERDFRIKIRVDSGTNEILDCYAVEDNVTEASCDSLDGVYSPADGKCREIKIQEDTSDPNSVYAITSRGSLLINNGGGLAIGTNPGGGSTEFLIDSGADLPGDGNLLLQNDADVRGNTDIQGNLNVEGTGKFEGNVGIGADPLPAGEARLIVQGSGSNAGIRVNDGTDQVEILSESSEAMSVRASGASRAGIRINTGSGDLIHGQKNGTTHFRVTDTGQVVIDKVSGFSMDIGVSGPSNPYFPAYIRNQPANPNNPSHWKLGGDKGDEIATKRWAAGVIYSEISDSDIESILTSIASYANNNQLDAIKRMVCVSARTRGELGTGGNRNGHYTSSSYGLGVCSHRVRHCSSGSDRCGNLFVSGINSTGEIFSNTRVRVQGAGAVRLNNNGTIKATSTISSDTVVSAPTVRGTGTSKTSGVCSANGCATRFGYQTCPTNAVMVGFAYGRIICTY